jgi:hypothetical protein
MEVLGSSQPSEKLAAYIELANSATLEKRAGPAQSQLGKAMISPMEVQTAPRSGSDRRLRAFSIWLSVSLVELTRWLAEAPDTASELPIAPGQCPFDALRLKDPRVEVIPALGAKFGYSDFLAALRECRDVKRIRLCPICDRIYWARRVDQPACSKRCNNVRHQRRWYRAHVREIKD